MTIEEAKRCLVQILEATAKYEEHTGKDTMPLDYHIPYFQSVIETILKELNADYPNWIPCTERLPRENQKVLVCLTDWETGDKEIDVTYRRDTNMWHGHGRYSVTNVAWMPLPEPYKGE